MNDFLSPLHEQEHLRKKRHLASWTSIFVLFALTFTLTAGNVSFFRVSILSLPQHAPFDGTTLPVQRVPSWVKLTTAEYKMPYDQIPAEKMTNLPKYTPSHLETPVSSLKWGNSADDLIRNEKITYSVPYMGSYRLNGKEYDGSHLAVDIKVPENTPVYAIANGVVLKVSNITSGFGKHIVLQHNGVPSMNDPSILTTIYSCYDHLSSLDVAEGSVVTKGQLIAHSGSTGFATTPHLHFQIDNDQAPFHPYWPFTYKEYSEAGLDFVGGVNAGLGKDKATLMTLSPMAYVEKYLNYTPSASTAPAVSSSPSPAVTSPEPTLPAAPVPTPSTPSSKPIASFSFSVTPSFQITDTVSIQVTAKDDSGTALTQFDGEILLMIMGNVGNLPKASLVSSDFASGSATVTLQNARAGSGQLITLYQGKQFVSPSFEIKNPETSSVAPSPETSSTPVVPQPVVLPATTLTSETPSTSSQTLGSSSSAAPETVATVVLKEGMIFADVGSMDPHAKAIEYLKRNFVLNGYQDRTFRPQNTISRVENLKMILEALKKPLRTTNNPPPFSDVNYGEWYGKYLMTAYESGIAQGYPNGTFRPSSNVTRAEFLKMLLETMSFHLDEVVTAAPYVDVPLDAWYTPYAAYAKKVGLLDSTITDFRAGEAVTREEVAEILYRVLVINQTGAARYTAELVSQ